MDIALPPAVSLPKRIDYRHQVVLPERQVAVRVSALVKLKSTKSDAPQRCAAQYRVKIDKSLAKTVLPVEINQLL